MILMPKFEAHFWKEKDSRTEMAKEFSNVCKVRLVKVLTRASGVLKFSEKEKGKK